MHFPLNSKKRRSSQRNRSHHARQTLLFEGLEQRKVFSGVTATVDDAGVLSVTGNDNVEDLRVYESQEFRSFGYIRYTVEVEGTVDNGTPFHKVFDREDVKQIDYWGYDGADRFENATDLPLVADGGSGADEIHGGGGNDRIYGQGENDVLYGHKGRDVIYGNLGNDLIHGGDGKDTIYGGQGDDEIYGDMEKAVHGGMDYSLDVAGTYSIASRQAYYLRAVSGGGDLARFDRTTIDAHEEWTIEPRGNKVAIKSTNGHYLRAISGGGKGVAVDRQSVDIHELFTLVKVNDSHYALQTHNGHYLTAKNGGNGWMNADATQIGQNEKFYLSRLNDMDDRIYGGNGNDHLYGQDGHDRVYGGQGDDWIWGSAGNDLLKGAGGDDVILGQSGDDDIYGNAGDDQLFGDQFQDMSQYPGWEGSDVLDGGTGGDSLLGTGGDDVIYTGGSLMELNEEDSSFKEFDWIRGGTGDDRIIANKDGVVYVDGEDGYDTFETSEGVVVGFHGSQSSDLVEEGLTVDEPTDEYEDASYIT